MKKSVVLAAVLLLLAANGALAEHGSADHTAGGHKLLVTDVPDPGQFEGRIDYVYSNATGKNEFDEKIRDEQSTGSVTLAGGVVKGLKLSASIPYTFVQHQEGQKIDGLGDLTLGARLALSKLVHLPLDLAVGLDWQLYSASARADRPGSGVNTFSPYIAVSKAHGMVTPYLKYQPDFVDRKDHDWINHNLTVGTELELTHKLSLDASVKTAINSARDGIKSSTDVEIELMPYINLSKNVYLLPRVAYKFVGDLKDEAGTRLVKDVGEVKAGLGIYVLF